jgi:hypothetical protein
VRRVGTLVAGAAVVLALGACSGSGGISPPTNLPTTITTSITLPTLPVQTQPETQTQTQTLTQTQTQTLTQTQTQTQTVTATASPSTVTVSATANPTTVTATASASTVTVTTTATATAAPQPQPTSAGLPTWVWIALAVLLLAVIGLVAWLIRRARVRAAWDERLAAARRTADWVEDSLVPQVVSEASTGEAAASWRAAGPRLLAADQELHDLGTTAPDPERAAAVEQLRTRLRALVDAVEADTSSTAAAGMDEMRARQAAIQSARTELRSFLTASTTPR